MSVQATPTEQVSIGFSVSAYGTHGTVPKEADLDWFFSVGQSLFEASTFGALLERQSAYGQTFETCTTCSGNGFDADDNSCPKCRGMGGTPSANAEKPLQHGLLFSTSRCEACIARRRGHWCCAGCDGYGYLNESGACCLKCRGSGQKLLASGKPRKRAQPRPRAVRCWSCAGRLYLDRHPAGVKAEAKTEPSYTPDDAALQRFAQVSRYLRQCKPDTVDVLAAFFGLSGYRWANTKWGRLFAVVPYTAAGEAMLAKVSNPLDLDDHKLLENVVDKLEKLTDQQHREHAQHRLEAVTRQAAEMFKSAAADWRSVVEPAPAPQAPEGLEAAA